MLRQPKLPGGASRCATGVLRMRLVMLREFRFASYLVITTLCFTLSFRPSGAPCHFDRAVASGEICGGRCRCRSGCNHAIRNMGFGYVRISCVQGYSVVGVFSCTLLAESVQDDAFSGDVCMKIVYERLFRVHIRCVPEGGDRFLDSACGVARNDRGKCLRPKPGMTGECLRPRAGMTGVVLRPKPE